MTDIRNEPPRATATRPATTADKTLRGLGDTLTEGGDPSPAAIPDILANLADSLIETKETYSQLVTSLERDLEAGHFTADRGPHNDDPASVVFLAAEHLAAASAATEVAAHALRRAEATISAIAVRPTQAYALSSFGSKRTNGTARN